MVQHRVSLSNQHLTYVEKVESGIWVFPHFCANIPGHSNPRCHIHAGTCLYLRTSPSSLFLVTNPLDNDGGGLSVNISRLSL
jgi:hypothetical protein